MMPSIGVIRGLNATCRVRMDLLLILTKGKIFCLSERGKAKTFAIKMETPFSLGLSLKKGSFKKGFFRRRVDQEREPIRDLKRRKKNRGEGKRRGA